MSQEAQKFINAVGIEVVKFLFSLALLTITWAGGRWLLSEWDFRKKSREIDLSIATQFQKLFGEFKEIWRLWRVSQVVDKNYFVPESTRWDLLSRAASAEGQVEAVLLKLATDRSLTPNELNTLGLFRQSFQTLSQGIRDGDTTRFNHKHPRYMLFNKLGAEVTHMILYDTLSNRPSSKQAYEAFQTIINVRLPQLKEAEEMMAVAITNAPLASV